VQPDIADLERGPLPDIDAHKVGGVLVEDVDLPQPVQQQFLADRAREPREESHGGGRLVVGGVVAVVWAVERLPLRREGLHK
jgi:hypothetical protein